MFGTGVCTAPLIGCMDIEERSVAGYMQKLGLINELG